MPQPLLSICVPSRNRQSYFQNAIASLLQNRTADTEFIFADNSDDGSIMRDFLAPYADDTLITFLPSENRVLSMQDNWERTIKASSGQWISFIGDDDYIDPAVALFISKIQASRPEVEAIDWEKLIYQWPGVEQVDGNNFIPVESRAVQIPQDLLMRRAFEWESAVVMPISGFSIYHGAVKRTLADRIADMCDGRYFEHPTPDIDFSFKSVLLGQGFVFSQRPFSVTGACPLSNTAGMYDFKKLKDVYDEFARDLGRDLNDDSYLADFPFSSILGVPASALQVQHWLKKKHNLSWTGWENNFVRCCQRFTELYRDRESFDQISSLYRLSLQKWNDGKYLNQYNPVFVPKAEGGQKGGGLNLDSKRLFFNTQLHHEQTASEHYRFASSILENIERLDSVPIDIYDYIQSRAPKPE